MGYGSSLVWYIVSTRGQYPEAYRALRENRYMDDILSGEDSREKREEQIEAEMFSLKFIVKSGEKSLEKAITDRETMKLLGYKGDPEKDELSPGLRELNLYKKLRGESKPNEMISRMYKKGKS